MSKKLPNIVLIILDSARKDMFGCYGNKEGLTPSMDAFAKKGLILGNHYAAGCGSAQAHVSLFTGRHSARHKMVHNFCKLSKDLISLPFLLKKLGYQTYGHMKFSTVPPAGYSDLFGFDELIYPQTKKKKDSVFSRMEFIITSLKNKLIPDSRILRNMARSVDGKGSLDHLLMKLKENKDGAAVFAYTTLLHPHSPYYPPKKFLKKVFKDQKIHKTSYGIQFNVHAYANGNFGEATEAMDSVRKCYKANLLYADFLIGDFIRRLEAEALLDDCIVVVTSDHGELLGEHGQINHGSTVWEELLDVPCIIYYPTSIKSGSLILNLTSGLDLVPTVFDLIGKKEWLNQETPLDGVSVFEKQFDWPQRYLVVDSPPVVLPARLKRYPNLLRKENIISRTLRTLGYKYIWQSNGDNYLLEAGEKEIAENNLILKKKDLADEFLKKMMDFYLAIDRNFKIDEYPIILSNMPEESITNPFIRDELVKLGYLAKAS